VRPLFDAKVNSAPLYSLEFPNERLAAEGFLNRAKRHQMNVNLISQHRYAHDNIDVY
jgi:hypothetical protein